MAEVEVKKKKVRTEIMVKATTAGMSPTVLSAAVEKEFEMALQDKVKLHAPNSRLSTHVRPETPQTNASLPQGFGGL